MFSKYYKFKIKFLQISLLFLASLHSITSTLVICSEVSPVCNIKLRIGIASIEQEIFEYMDSDIKARQPEIEAWLKSPDSGVSQIYNMLNGYSDHIEHVMNQWLQTKCLQNQLPNEKVSSKCSSFLSQLKSRWQGLWRRDLPDSRRILTEITEERNGIIKLNLSHWAEFGKKQTKKYIMQGVLPSACKWCDN